MDVHIRQAGGEDKDTVVSILHEAAAWLEQEGMPMWHPHEIDTDGLVAGVAAGEFYLAEWEGIAAGTLRFQETDTLFWPDTPQEEAAYIHRFAVRRVFAGRGVSRALLQWAVDRTRSLGRTYLRLDCQAARPKLRGVYENFGFRHHSDRQVGPFYVARYEYNVEQVRQ